MSLERPVRRMEFRVFQHATEDPEKVRSALLAVSGGGEVRSSRAEGYHGNPIVILETTIGNRAELESFWQRVREAGLCPGLAANLEERIDGSGELFVRFDKQEAVGGRLALSAGDDVVQARGRVMRVSSGQEVRADRDTAIAVMRQFLDRPGQGGDGKFNNQ